jgi:hypothetical protein
VDGGRRGRERERDRERERERNRERERKKAGARVQGVVNLQSLMQKASNHTGGPYVPLTIKMWTIGVKHGKKRWHNLSGFDFLHLVSGIGFRGRNQKLFSRPLALTTISTL